MLKALFKNAMQTVSLLVVLCTAGSYISPFVNPALFRWFSYFGTAYPWWLLLNVGLVVFWLTQLNRFVLYHIIMILLGEPYFETFLGLNRTSRIREQDQITIVTHNLGTMFSGKGGVTKQRAEELAEQYAQFLKEHGQPDIICTQETQGVFYPILGKKLGYDQRFNLKKGTVILSRFPILAGGDIPFGRTSNSTLWADIRLPSGEVVRVYNVHLQSNKVTTDATRIIDGEQDLDAIGRVMDKVGDATSTRTEQAQRLRDHLLSAKHPVIVCGDFNDTPNSYVYRVVSRGLSDSFKESGQGLGHTFAGAIPFLRIDYILMDPGFKATGCDVVRERRWSDHYPVFTQLVTP